MDTERESVKKKSEKDLETIESLRSLLASGSYRTLHKIMMVMRRRRKRKSRKRSKTHSWTWWTSSTFLAVFSIHSLQDPEFGFVRNTKLHPAFNKEDMRKKKGDLPFDLEPPGCRPRQSFQGRPARAQKHQILLSRNKSLTGL